VIRCCEDSLRRLQTDHIDLYQIHMQDIETPEEELLRALDDLVSQGKIHYIGCSNYAAYRLDGQPVARRQPRLVALRLHADAVQPARARHRA
jgi:aryl-alcohol dehydrogenase-like predicted oxidoreductase